MDLNNPDIRQQALIARLSNNQPLIAANIAREFNVSLDTIRRDLIALERGGRVRRVRGGALPVRPPSLSMLGKLEHNTKPPVRLTAAALPIASTAQTLFLDGGSTVLALAKALPKQDNRLVVTPSPWVATACAERGDAVHLIGGLISISGGIAVGPDARRDLQRLNLDLAILGACGLDAHTGLSSDVLSESLLKREAGINSQSCAILAPSAKIGLRAPYQTLSPDQIDHIISDADPEGLDAFQTHGIEITHV